MLPSPDREAPGAGSLDRGPISAKTLKMASGWMPCCYVGCSLRNSIDTLDMPSPESPLADHIEALTKHQASAVQLRLNHQQLPPCLSKSCSQLTESTKHDHSPTLQQNITWQMEDHLCPRLVQPQAACLLCLSRLSQEPAITPTTKSHNRVRFSATTKAPKPSHQSPAPTTAAAPARTRARHVDHATQHPAPRPIPAPTPPHHNSLQNHTPRTHDLDKFSANITTTAIPAEAAQVPHQCESSPLYARLMKRYSASTLLNPWSKPINSRRSLPTPR
jgi:hypothetical protein